MNTKIERGNVYHFPGCGMWVITHKHLFIGVDEWYATRLDVSSPHVIGEYDVQCRINNDPAAIRCGYGIWLKPDFITTNGRLRSRLPSHIVDLAQRVMHLCVTWKPINSAARKVTNSSDYEELVIEPAEYAVMELSELISAH